MWARVVLIVAAGVLVGCSGGAAPTQVPSGSAMPTATTAASTPAVTPAVAPSDTPGASATPVPTPEPTISYVCPYVTMEEIAAIAGRTVLKAGRSINEHLCSWVLGSKTGQPAGETTHAWLRDWADMDPEQRFLTVELFTGNYSMMSPTAREPGVGEGAYWQPSALNFLYRGHVYVTEYQDAALSEAELRGICVAIAEAAIPRL